MSTSLPPLVQAADRSAQVAHVFNKGREAYVFIGRANQLPPVLHATQLGGGYG